MDNSFWYVYFPYRAANHFVPWRVKAMERNKERMAKEGLISEWLKARSHWASVSAFATSQTDLFTRKHSSRMRTDRVVTRPSSEPVSITPIVDKQTRVKTLPSLAVGKYISVDPGFSLCWSIEKRNEMKVPQRLTPLRMAAMWLHQLFLQSVVCVNCSVCRCQTVWMDLYPGRVPWVKDGNDSESPP